MIKNILIILLITNSFYCLKASNIKVSVEIEEGDYQYFQNKRLITYYSKDIYGKSKEEIARLPLDDSYQEYDEEFPVKTINSFTILLIRTDLMDEIISQTTFTGPITVSTFSRLDIKIKRNKFKATLVKKHNKQTKTNFSSKNKKNSWVNQDNCPPCQKKLF